MLETEVHRIACLSEHPIGRVHGMRVIGERCSINICQQTEIILKVKAFFKKKKQTTTTKNNKKINKNSSDLGMVWHTTIISILWRQRQEDQCKFEVNLIYIVSSLPRPARAT